MSVAEYKVDRTGWPAGPWDAEPDRVEWRDAATGLTCLIVRGLAGNLCGYVGVPPGHPDHGNCYDEIDARVHGGLTYADACSGAVCHVPAPGEPEELWWLGFACAHALDLVPLMAHGLDMPGDFGGNRGEYKTIAFVAAECARLAEQLAGHA